MICRAWARARAWESAHACLCDSYPGDIHDLDGCQLPGLNMATLVRGGKERDGQKTKKDGKVYTTAHGWWNGTRTVLSALNRSISIYLCCILKLRSDTQILGICTAVCLSGSIKQHSTYCKQDILKVIRSNKRQIQQLTPTLKIMIANCRYSQTDRKVQWRIQIKPLSKLLIIYDWVVRAKKSKSTSPNQSVSLWCRLLSELFHLTSRSGWEAQILGRCNAAVLHVASGINQKGKLTNHYYYTASRLISNRKGEG